MTTTTINAGRGWPRVDPEPAHGARARRAAYDAKRAEHLAAEAAALADMKRVLQPFPEPRVEPKAGWKFPRAGVRLRADGRAQLTIWNAPGERDAILGGTCGSRTEAFDLGWMKVQYARQAAL